MSQNILEPVYTYSLTPIDSGDDDDDDIGCGGGDGGDDEDKK